MSSTYSPLPPLSSNRQSPTGSQVLSETEEPRPVRNKTFGAVQQALLAPARHLRTRSKTMSCKVNTVDCCRPDRLKIFIGTWNMYGRLAPIDLDTFLTRHRTDWHESTLPHLDSSATHPYHLLAIGTQECERDISESLFYPSKEIWEQKLATYLGQHYTLIETETLAALHLAVFVWTPVKHYVTGVETEHIKTGWANMVGNKGAVAISLLFGTRSLLFINCHLTAHASHLMERNANVHRILHDLKMKDPKTSNKEVLENQSILERFDHTFFFGDTNYRVEGERPWVLETLYKGDYNLLLDNDQLTQQRRLAESPLSAFEEHPICFPPTFKFDTITMPELERSSSSEHSGSSRLAMPCVPAAPGMPLGLCYDSSSKQRVPSWTDRILWYDRMHHHERIKRNGPKMTPSWWHRRGQKRMDTECWLYSAVMEESLAGVSDHMPVIGVFGIHFDSWLDLPKPQRIKKPRISISKPPSIKKTKAPKGKDKKRWWKRLLGIH
ncbi:Endonuclease/exonuclease/phosphatase [Spinellus fusiger]|nr:Endonuclease/exonuclease/phosphatase [Spinellus fusiger]